MFLNFFLFIAVASCYNIFYMCVVVLFFLKYNSIISRHRQKVLTAADNLYGNPVWECVTGDPFTPVLAAIAQNFIYSFFTVRFVTVWHNCLHLYVSFYIIPYFDKYFHSLHAQKPLFHFGIRAFRQIMR